MAVSIGEKRVLESYVGMEWGVSFGEGDIESE